MTQRQSPINRVQLIMFRKLNVVYFENESKHTELFIVMEVQMATNTFQRVKVDKLRKNELICAYIYVFYALQSRGRNVHYSMPSYIWRSKNIRDSAKSATWTQVVVFSAAAPSSPWTWRHHGPPKRWQPITSLHVVTTQKTTTWTIAVKTSRSYKTLHHNFQFKNLRYSLW
jgi:hypothetical protein